MTQIHAPESTTATTNAERVPTSRLLSAARPTGDSPATGSGQGPMPASAKQELRSVQPRVDVFEDASGITLLADLPGVPREQLDIEIDGETLTIDGTVAIDTPDELQTLYSEVRVPRYRRSFTLSSELDRSRIAASLKDGVLRLRVPKQAQAQARRIEVQVG